MNAPLEHQAQPCSAQQPIFRTEVLEARANQWSGTIQVTQRFSAWLIVAAALLILVLFLTFVIFGEYSKRARITGITTPISGSVTVLAPGPGTLLRQYVEEGGQVAMGDPIFEISSTRFSSGGEATVLLAEQISRRQLAVQVQRRSRVHQAEDKQRALKARLSNLDAEVVQLEEGIKLSRGRERLAEESLKQYQVLQSNGFISTGQVQQKEADLLEIRSQLSSLGRNKVQLDATRISLVAEQSTLASDLTDSLAQLDQEAASLRQELIQNQDKSTTVVKAPYSGTLTTVTNHVGQSIAAGQVLGTLISDSGKSRTHAMEVDLYAPSRSIGFVSIGQRVLLRYEAFPYQKFGLYEGQIVDVSRTPLAPNELPTNISGTILSNMTGSNSGSNAEALYRIRVRPLQQIISAYGKEYPLKPGMTLQADVLQDKRSILEWIMEPLIAASRRSIK